RPELAGDLDVVLNSVSRAIDDTVAAAQTAGLVKASDADPKAPAGVTAPGLFRSINSTYR
ncbi:MAG TPA: hypothetical protein VGL39_27990, partial [Jatrophihabitantaceae bacterium]